MAGQESFQQRLARINGGQSNNWTIPGAGIAAPGGVAPSEVKANTIVRTNSIGENIKYPLSFVWAFALGIFAYCFARYASFQISGMALEGDVNAGTVVYDLAITAAVIFALRMMFKLENKELTAAQGIGAFAAYTMFHNLAFWIPDLMTLAFDKEYVRAVIAWAEPNSIFFRGNYYVF